MARHVFRCIDGHTAGNPVRLVIEGAPELTGDSMSARRQDFMTRYDWIRTGLCFEPRGHERVRPPRHPLVGARRAEVIAMVEKAAATRPVL